MRTELKPLQYFNSRTGGRLCSSYLLHV